MMKLTPLLVPLLVCAAAFSADQPILDSMDALTFRQPKEKATVELVDGKIGKALKFAFADGCLNTFCGGKFRGTPEWDKAPGFSFWAKGDGSDHLGGFQMIWNEDYAVRYGFAFRIDNTEWKKVVVRWRDLIPELSNAQSKPLGLEGNAPSKLGSVNFGKWWYWKNYAAHSYLIDDFRLEMELEAPKIPEGNSTSRVLEKLKAGKAVTIVTMGDSLTDFAHWANKPVNWPTLLKEKLREKYKCDVTLVNPAIGGTELRQNTVLISRWLQKTPEPDLVTILFGYNDWESGMRGPAFVQTLQHAIDQVRIATNGKADVLIITSAPTLDKWDTFAELADACRASAKNRTAGLADIYKAFHEYPAAECEKLYCKDRGHLGLAGHELVAKTVMTAIEK